MDATIGVNRTKMTKLNQNQINSALLSLESKRAQALKQLKELDYQLRKEKYSNVPDYAIAPSKFEDKTTNGLTDCVIKWLQLNGHYCSRIQSQGQYRESLGTWTKSTVKRGIGDIIAIVRGQSLMIEIKAGADKQSEFQKETESEVTSSGGTYLLVRSFADFLDFYNSL